MSVPNAVHVLLLDASSAVMDDPDHHLATRYRQALYHAFGPLIDLSGARFRHLHETGHLDDALEHRRYGYLALLTARHVVPFWERGSTAVRQRFPDIPPTMPQDMLALGDAVLHGRIHPDEACGVLFNDWYHMMHGLRHSPYPAWCAVQAAYAATEMILGVPVDVTDAAVQAYSAIDTNDPARTPLDRNAVQFDPVKRLAFWAWWLNEAIPTAWGVG